MDIKGNTFIVTGGGSGLGAAVVRMVVEAGGRAVIADVDEAAGRAMEADLGVSVRFVLADITQEIAAQQVVDIASGAFGPLRGLVNCAGITIGERTLGREGPHRLASFARVINVNLIGTFNMIRLAAAALARAVPDADGERGVVINTASVAAFDGQIGQAAYAASKAGVVGMTLPIARDLARSGIRIMTIAPGLFETPMLMGLPVEVRESLGRNTPFPPRLGRPSEYAALVRHIIGNAMLNGEVIRLDGAVRLEPK